MGAWPCCRGGRFREGKVNVAPVVCRGEGFREGKVNVPLAICKPVLQDVIRCGKRIS